jgi:hypothetical protein
VGPPPPGATRELGVVAMLLSPMEIYARKGALSTPLSRAYSPKCPMALAGPPRNHEKELPPSLFLHQCLEEEYCAVRYFYADLRERTSGLEPLICSSYEFAAIHGNLS